MAKDNKKTTRWYWTHSILWRAFIISAIVHFVVMYVLPTGRFFTFEPGYIEVESVELITFSEAESSGEPEDSISDASTATAPVQMPPGVADIPTQIEAVEPEIALDRNPDEQWESAFIGLAPESVEDVPPQISTQLVPRTVTEPELPQTDVIETSPRVHPKQIPASETSDEPSSEPEIRPQDEVARSVEQPFEAWLQARAIERATVNVEPDFSESQIPEVLDTDFPSLSVSRESRKTDKEPLLPVQSGDMLKAPSKQVPTSDIVDETSSGPEIQPENEVAMVAEQPFDEWLQARAIKGVMVDIDPDFSESQIPEILAIDSPSLSLSQQSRQEFAEPSSPDPSIIPVQPETLEKTPPSVVVLPDVPDRDIAPDEESIAVATSGIVFQRTTSLSNSAADVELPEFALSRQFEVPAQQIQTPVALDERQKLLTENVIPPRMTPVSKDETGKEPILPQAPEEQPVLSAHDSAQAVVPTPHPSLDEPQKTPEDVVPLPLPEEILALASIEPPPDDVQEFPPILRARTLSPDQPASVTPLSRDETRKEPILPQVPVEQPVLPAHDSAQVAMPTPQPSGDVPQKTPEDAVPVPISEPPILASIEPPSDDVQEFSPILRAQTLSPEQSVSITQPAVPPQQQRKPMLLTSSAPLPQAPVLSTDVQTQAVLPERRSTRPSQTVSPEAEQSSDVPRFSVGLRQPQRELQRISSPGRPTLFAENKRSSEVNDKEETTSLFSGQAQFGLPIKKHIMLPEAEASSEVTLEPKDAIKRADKTNQQDTMNAFVIEGPAATRRVISKPRRFPEVELDKEVDIRLQFWVLPDGTVGDVIPLERGDVQLERAAIEYLKNWRFTPVDPGQPRVWGIMPITYTLR